MRDFEIPTVLARTMLVAGDYAQLVFVGGERLWVRVTGTRNASSCLMYEGVVESTPVDPDAVGVDRGSEVSFDYLHVCKIARGGELVG